MAETQSKTKARYRLNSAIRAINHSVNPPGIRLSKETIEQLNLIGIGLLRKIYHLALESIHNAGQKTFEYKTIVKVITELSSIESAESFLRQTEKAIEIYKEGVEELNLLISPSLVAKHIRLHNPTIPLTTKKGKYEARISIQAKIAVAAFLEEFFSLLLRTAGSNLEGQTVRVRELLLAVEHDQTLKDFFQRNKIILLRAGVSSYTPDFLLLTKEKREENDSNRRQAYRRRNDTIKPRTTARPGAKRRKEITLSQEQMTNVIGYKPGKALIDSILSFNQKQRYRSERNAVIDIICYAETRLIEIMRETLELVNLTGRVVSLDPKVLVRVAEIHGLVLRETTVQIKHQTAMRLAARAGSVRTMKKKGGEVLEDAVSAILQAIIADLLQAAIAAMDMHEKTTLKTKYTFEGALALGYIIPSYKRDPKKTTP